MMDEDDGWQWPEYLRVRMSAFRSCFANPRSHEDNITFGFRVPAATFALLVCTKIQTLVMHSIYPVPPALGELSINGCLNIDPNDSKKHSYPSGKSPRIHLEVPLAFS